MSANNLTLQFNPLDILKKYWGYEGFRPLQHDIIQSVLEGVDTLALMPTGGGKSICFQVPALCRPGICIVISPLIALMKDQVEQLRKRSIAAEAIYSGMHPKEIDRILDNCVYGAVKLLYLSPERLGTDMAQERIAKMQVNLIAVDESHCISQWGYDFRPSYLQIAGFRSLAPHAPVLALTATATTEVVQDIQNKLAFANGKVFQKSFARPNLAYMVIKEEGKAERLIQILKKVKGSSVIYVRNRKKTRETAILLQRNGIAADYYHAGLNAEDRSRRQEAWMQNKIAAIVSTNAFGMGIDKPDVRVVVHLDLPDSLEAYFQEAGRAGRDGQKAYAVLLYNESDKSNLLYQFETTFPDIHEIRAVYRALGSYFQLALGAGKGQTYDFNLTHFADTFQMQPNKVFHALKILEQSGWLVVSEAVYSPAGIQILADKQSLYDFQLREPRFDPLVKAILRTCQGVLHSKVSLKETQLAKFLKTDPKTIKNALIHLHAQGILEYHPQKEEPQLFFMQERVQAEHLTIDQAQYQFRKQRQQFRIQQAIRYAESDRCRNVLLLQYFGESQAKNCGVCDICMQEKKPGLSNIEFISIRQQIRDLLKQKGYTVKELTHALGGGDLSKTLKALEFLIQEGYVVQKAEQLFWKQGTS